MAMTDPDWLARFDALGALPARLRDRLAREARVLEVPAGTAVFAPGMVAGQFLLLLDGSVRVQHITETGRQIVLYRVAAGQTCIMTTACLLSHDAYAAEGVAETPCRAVTIPEAAFEAALAEPGFRQFVFRNYAQRLTELLALLEDVAFARLDVRLAQRLLALSRGAERLEITHQGLADEIGTAREVVSRALQEMQRGGLIALSRGAVTLCDRPALERLAAGQGGRAAPR